VTHDHHDHGHDHHGHDHHGHGHHGHGHHHHATDNIRVALALNLVFSLIELIGGLYTQSIAVLADSLHDFGDSLALGAAWYMQEKSEKGADSTFSYGYRRLSLLSAIFTGMFLVIGSVFILKESISRLNSPLTPNTKGMALLAILGIAVNGYAAWKVGRGGSMNERVISLHMLEDLFGWIAVLIGSIIMSFTNLPWIDPILSIGFTLFILRGVYRSLGATIRLFLQAVPENIDLRELLSKIRKVPGTLGVHDCHVWSLDGERHVLTMHVIVDPTTTVPAIEILKQKIRQVVDTAGRFHLTIEIECDPEKCPDRNCVVES
jgi:cobalt-zinc-cadmium efflux system protein